MMITPKTVSKRLPSSAGAVLSLLRSKHHIQPRDWLAHSGMVKRNGPGKKSLLQNWPSGRKPSGCIITNVNLSWIIRISPKKMGNTTSPCKIIALLLFRSTYACIYKEPSYIAFLQKSGVFGEGLGHWTSLPLTIKACEWLDPVIEGERSQQLTVAKYLIMSWYIWWNHESIEHKYWHRHV